MGQEFKHLFSVFFSKTYIFFSIFFYSRTLVTTWITCSTLQNINSSIRLAVNSLWKGLLCPQPSKQCCSKRTFRVPLRQNYTSATRTTFQRQTTFMVEVKGQSQSFPRNFKIHEKNCQRSQFFEKFWLLSLPTSLRAITLLPVLDRNAQNKSRNNFKKLRAGMTFLKKSLFDPPPPQPAKSFLTSISLLISSLVLDFFLFRS